MVSLDAPRGGLNNSAPFAARDQVVARRGGAEEREDQRVEAARLDDAPVAVVDDLVREHAVLEGPVGGARG
jgi:hypothetical protein